jgi:uncharacterized protein (DUF608 family)
MMHWTSHVSKIVKHISESSEATKKGEEIATAVCAHCKVEAHSSNYVELSLSWDMPVINFRAKETMYKKYVDYYLFLLDFSLCLQFLSMFTMRIFVC